MRIFIYFIYHVRIRPKKRIRKGVKEMKVIGFEAIYDKSKRKRLETIGDRERMMQTGGNTGIPR